jgi:hypothetical protein
MKMHFIVGPFGCGRQKVFKRLLTTLKESSDNNVVGDGIGGTAGSKNIGGLNRITLELCLYEIQRSLTMFENKEHYVFTGTGLTKYIREIMVVYPNACLYMLKRSDPAVELSISAQSGLIDKFDLTEEWLTSYNLDIRSNLESYASDLGTNWRPVNTPLFNGSSVPNWATSLAETNSGLEMAVYNL